MSRILAAREGSPVRVHLSDGPWKARTRAVFALVVAAAQLLGANRVGPTPRGLGIAQRRATQVGWEPPLRYVTLLHCESVRNLFVRKGATLTPHLGCADPLLAATLAAVTAPRLRVGGHS